MADLEFDKAVRAYPVRLGRRTTAYRQGDCLIVQAPDGATRSSHMKTGAVSLVQFGQTAGENDGVVHIVSELE